MSRHRRTGGISRGHASAPLVEGIRSVLGLFGGRRAAARASDEPPSAVESEVSDYVEVDTVPFEVLYSDDEADALTGAPASDDGEDKKDARWSPHVFSVIEWRRFEAVVEALFAQAGFSTRTQPREEGEGSDIWLYSRNSEGPVSVVQCKHWFGKPVTVKEMRELLNAMISKGVRRGTFATTSRYSMDAMVFADANGINAQDGPSLLKLIARRTPQQQAELLEVAYEGEYWKPTCVNCGVKMTERMPEGGVPFWGCVNHPQCTVTQALRAV